MEAPDLKKENLKPEIISDEEINAFRKELEERKKKIEGKFEEFKKGQFFPDAELLDVDFNELKKPDWFLYKLLKNGKLNLKILGQYRTKEIGPQTIEILETVAKKGHSIDFSKLPREAYMAWLSNQFTNDLARKKLKERKIREVL